MSLKLIGTKLADLLISDIGTFSVENRLTKTCTTKQ